MSSHKLPQPSDPLPSLTHAERTLIHKAARLVRKGRLDEVRLRRHEKKGVLVLQWSEGAKGRLCR
jgi:hypothetical protein